MTFQPINPETLKVHVEKGLAFEYDGKGGMNLSPARPTAGDWKPAPNPHVWDCRDIPGMYMKKDDKAYKWETPARTPSGHKKKTQAKVRRPQKAPASKRGEVVDTIDQNEHMWRILNDRELSPAQVGVATRLHYYAFTSRKGDPKGKCVRAMATMAAHCNCSLNTFKEATRVLIERGYFRRDDDGKGGSSGKGAAIWIPTLPAWSVEGVN